MSDTIQADPRETLRQEWLANAGSVFDRLFPAEAGPEPSFDFLEQRSVQLVRDLASWLLESRAAASPHVRPASPAPCPNCQRPGVPDPERRLRKRTLATEVGDIGLAREKWRCTACRVVFFPPR